jgi:small subunit ribosomal protein S20
VANHKSTLKRMRQNVTLRAHHRHYRSIMRTQIKVLNSAIEAGDSELAKSELNKTTAVIQRMSSKGIIHSNQAARRVSRLTVAVNKI